MDEPSLNEIQVEFQPVGRKVRVPAGVTLLEAAQRAGVDLVASCGGMGICGTCQVRILDGPVNPVTADECAALEADENAAGLRLACRVIPAGNVRVFLPASSLARAQQLQVTGVETGSAFDPLIRAVDLELPAPSFDDLRADLTRVDEALAASVLAPLQAGPAHLDALSRLLRASDWAARLIVRPAADASALVACLPAGALFLGLALDIGSTKIALYLVDLESGGTLASQGMMNPQIAFGEDVISRIAYANGGDEQRRRLQTVLIDSINQAAAELCAQAGARTEQICDWVVVGNTAIHHLFCGLPVEQLGLAPYVPAVQRALAFPAAEVGLHSARGAQVYLPPNIAGFVGADHVSALVAARLHDCAQTSLLADIGTNTEISLAHNGRIYSCSCASGPAFEGAHIRDGMRAAPGAIERVDLSGRDRRVHTIGGLPPIGICGSGILSAVAEMHRQGWINDRGAIVNGEVNGFVLAPAAETGHGRDIVVTRKDVHEIQLAKGAIRAGIEVLLQRAGVCAEQVEEWIVAGAFGTHIDLGAAVQVGMFPRLPLDRFHQVGNAAGVGSRQMLLSVHRRAEAGALPERIEYIELTTEPGFQQEYLRWLFFRS